MLPVAILCGGKGTRVAAIAGDLPKALIPIRGEPFLAHQLRGLRARDVTDVVLLTGYGADRVRAFARDGAAFGLHIAYHDDGAAPRGTAGAIADALHLLGDRFLTLYGDALLDADLGAVAAALEPPYEGVMTVYHNADEGLPSNVALDGPRVRAYAKEAARGSMTHIDYGINAFTASAFDGVPPGVAVDLATVHRAMIARGTLRAFPVTERWHEIGSPEGIAETEHYLATRFRRDTSRP